ncbi:hypothetical protein T310_8053, partial [Rasamsonia emersonii CBS 393.64]
AFPIQDRDSAGTATETRWPASCRASTNGRTYGESFFDGGPSSFTTCGLSRELVVSSLLAGHCRIHAQRGEFWRLSWREPKEGHPPRGLCRRRSMADSSTCHERQREHLQGYAWRTLLGLISTGCGRRGQLVDQDSKLRR